MQGLTMNSTYTIKEKKWAMKTELIMISSGVINNKKCF